MLNKAILISSFFLFGYFPIKKIDYSSNKKEIHLLRSDEAKKEIISLVNKSLETKKLKELKIIKFTEIYDKSTCSVSCTMSVEYGGITTTFSASAGNFLSSCDRASKRCQEKLMHQLIDMLYT